MPPPKSLYSARFPPATDRNLGVQSNKKVDVYLRVKNATANGLGPKALSLEESL